MTEDPALCPYCERPLDDGRPIQTSLDGGSAHADCVAKANDDEGERAE